MRGKLKALVVFVLSAVWLLGGCSQAGGSRVFETPCAVSLSGLPDEYRLLPESVRENLVVSVSLRSVSSDKTQQIQLTGKNRFRRTLNLVPGVYDVTGARLSNEALAMFRVKPASSTIKIKKGVPAECPIQVVSPAGFAAAMKNNRPKKELLSRGIFSRVIQYNGRVIKMDDLKKSLKFPKMPQTDLKPSATTAVASSSPGISAILQNRTNKYAPVSKATVVGLAFTRNNVVFPKGITLGMDVSSISHARTGALGTPTYCKGMPLLRRMVGSGDSDSLLLVYLDKVSGDRISFHVDLKKPYVTSVLYEFEKYE